MKSAPKKTHVSEHRRAIRSAVLLLGVLICLTARSSNLDLIGVNLLRTTSTNLDGSGIPVAHPEGSTAVEFPTFEVSPVAVGQPVSRFTYHSALGSSTNFPNSVGNESFSHANFVGMIFYGIPDGVATNVFHVDNYDADFLIASNIFSSPMVAIPGVIVNQSYIFIRPEYQTNLTLRISEQIEIDLHYDQYAATFGTLFISAAGSGSGGTIYAPGSAYNGIGVGVSDTGFQDAGPTLDNGRSKPDISAPGGSTSAATPYVAGSATVLLQAAHRGDGGSDTNSAGDKRTIKALLLNGALKPAGWTNGPSTPLDARHGAGVVNLFNAYRQLAAGKHTNINSTSVPTGNVHPPTGATGTVGSLQGWDFAAISSTMANDRINHYYFDVTNAAGTGPFTLTATLVWNRQENQAAINDLDLLLYNTATSNVVAESTGFVNNVEHIYIRHLQPGRYDLQVWKAGGNAGNGRITNDETYALAWEFFAMPLHITPTGTNVVLTWPIYPTGFILESTASLSPANWSTNLPAPLVNNGTNQVTVSTANSATFFRLRRP
jgi:hypothetical protein